MSGVTSSFSVKSIQQIAHYAAGSFDILPLNFVRVSVLRISGTGIGICISPPMKLLGSTYCPFSLCLTLCCTSFIIMNAVNGI
jgi:hypothetical protein